MMKFTGAIGTCLAALVVVPSSTFDGEDAGTLGSLQSALTKTVQALEFLSGMRERTETGRPAELEVLLEVTEPPMFEGGPSPERDQMLDLLRTQVSLLQEELDLVEQRMLERERAGEEPEPTEAAAPARPGFTRGLDPDSMAVLKKIGNPATAPAPSLAERAEGTDIEYSANVLLQAQACYRAGLYERGANLLIEEPSAEGRYWRARCLERLERLDEASELYTAIAEMPDVGSFAERARTNLEFVTWKLDFVGRLAKEKQSGRTVEAKR